MPRPGSIPPIARTATLAALAVAAALGFGLLAQWPLISGRPLLVTANLVVAGGFALGAVLLSDQQRDTPARVALLAAAFLWSAAWLQGWHAGPFPFIASLVGPAAECSAIWGLLQYPRPWGTLRRRRALVALLVVAQLASALATFTDVPDHWWPTLNDAGLHAVTESVYDDGGVVLTVVLAAAYVAHVIALDGLERRVTVPVLIAVAAGAVATATTDLASGLGIHGPLLSTWYAVEALLLATVPVAFAVSYFLRRLSIEELSGRIDPYASNAAIRHEFRRVLHDPSLEIWTPVGERWADADGQFVEHYETAGRFAEQVAYADTPAAVITYRVDLTRFGQLIAAAAAALAVTLHANQLRREVEVAIVAARESRRRLAIVGVLEQRQVGRRAELGPLAHLLHTRQAIAAATAAIRAGTVLADDAAIVAGSRLQHADQLLGRAVSEIETISTGGDPERLDEGLAVAVPIALQHLPIAYELQPVRADRPQELAAFFMITEAVTNALKHAGDTLIAVRVAPARDANALAVSVTDTGPGGADAGGHGLTRMAEKLHTVGGTLTIHSPAGGPTTLSARLPLAATAL